MAFDSPYQLLTHLKEEISKNEANNQLAGTRRYQCISFQVANQSFMTPIHDVTEIIPRAHLHELPGVQSWVKGVIQVRGELIIINDLSEFLYARQTNQDERLRILIIETHGEKVGFLLSKIESMQWVDEQNIIKLNEQMGSRVSYLKSAYVHDQGQVPIIDLKTLVQHPLFLQASKVA